MGLAGAVRPFPALAALVWQSPLLSRSDSGAGSMLGGGTPRPAPPKAPGQGSGFAERVGLSDFHPH